VNLYVKLCGAAALVVVGFILARVMGEPKLSKQLLENGSLVMPTIAGSDASDSSASPQINSDVRLVPDFDSTQNVKYFNENEQNEVPPPLLPLDDGLDLTNKGTSPMVNDDKPIEAPQFFEIPKLISDVNSVPRARLRREAPRPLVSETYQQDSTTPAECVGETAYQENSFGTAVHASYLTPTEPEVVSTKSSYPLPATNEILTPRTHVVVDGDSLSRLAARYLGDARRAAEIYELNRGLLADPELLPIGLELTIPPRDGSHRTHHFPAQAHTPAAVASVAGYDLVPVRPVPSERESVPRAQLLRPTAAD
jgi:phage tail protein X